jgi:preprotein translocase subunit SecB
MAEEASAAPQIKMQVLAQFVRDMSFENMVAQKGLTSAEVQPDIQVAVSLDARKRAQENQYDVVTKFKVTSKNKVNGETLFLLELDYAGVFLVENVPEEQMHPFLLIECPRLLFPFVRRIISDVTRDGGFPPLNIDTVDFLALYRQELSRRAAAQPQAQPQTVN